MKAIRVKLPFGEGYVEAEVFNLGKAGWRHFLPDPRKKQLNKPKFRWLEGSFGNIESLCEKNWLNGHFSCHSVAVCALREAERRYMQRYQKFGELGNAQMPADPDFEIFMSILERVRPKLQTWDLKV